MKLILKNLKQAQFEIEVESEKTTVLDLKNEIEKLHGFDSKQIKLLQNGKVLADVKTLEEYQIKYGCVIIMMNTKPKPKEEPKSEEQPKPSSPKKEEPQKKEEEKPSSNYSNQINTLIEMGYDRAKVEEAINASKGNLNQAIEYLNKGNIPQPSSQPPQSVSNDANKPTANLPMELRRNGSLMKIVCRDDPEKIYLLLNSIKQKNPGLLNKIKEREEDFKNYLISPINQQDIDNFKLIEEDYRGILSNRRRQIQIQLTPEESQSVKKLKELGFSESEVIQAYFACDKNEELAANYLFEQRMYDEQEENNNNYGQ